MSAKREVNQKGCGAALRWMAARRSKQEMDVPSAAASCLAGTQNGKMSNAVGLNQT